MLTDLDALVLVHPAYNRPVRNASYAQTITEYVERYRQDGKRVVTIPSAAPQWRSRPLMRALQLTTIIDARERKIVAAIKEHIAPQSHKRIGFLGMYQNFCVEAYASQLCKQVTYSRGKSRLPGTGKYEQGVIIFEGTEFLPREAMHRAFH